MERQRLLTEIKAYAQRYPLESVRCQQFCAFVEREPHCFERSTVEGHITASAFVLSPQLDQVLLLHHRKLERWLQPGGHCDGDPIPERTARREVAEECGVGELELLEPEIFDLDIHEIPARGEVPAHLHYDVRYLFRVASLSYQRNDESTAISWVPLNETEAHTQEESILRMREKAVTYRTAALSASTLSSRSQVK